MTTNRLVKSLAAVAAVAALAGAPHVPAMSGMALAVPAAQAGQSADELVGYESSPARAAVAPGTAKNTDDKRRVRGAGRR
jgi:hypothetical protein